MPGPILSQAPGPLPMPEGRAPATPGGDTGDGETNVSQATGAARYEIALIGDMPYGDVGRAQFPHVIDEINDDRRISFTVFDGDTKNGSERCDQPQYDLAATNFGSFRRP